MYRDAGGRSVDDYTNAIFKARAAGDTKAVKYLEAQQEAAMVAEERQAERSGSGGEYANVGKVSSQFLQMAKTGNMAKKELESLIFDKKGNVRRDVILAMKNPGGVGLVQQEGREALSWFYRVVESKLRLDTGAAAPEQEKIAIKEALGLFLTDSPQTMRTKLRVYANTFDEIERQARADPSGGTNFEDGSQPF